VRYLVLADVHANIDALEAVLAEAARATYDHVLLLGDLVGYGGEPNAVVDRIRSLSPMTAVRGNHDRVAAGLADTEGFNPLAKDAAEWTLHAVSATNRAFLAAMPLGPLAVDALIEICHGAPFDEDAYVVDSLDALKAMTESRRPVCVYGHTHIPMAMALIGKDFRYEDVEPGRALILDPDGRYVINAGSVGQPRDGDPRAAWAVIDTAARCVEFHRTPYDIAAAQERIRRAGLPDSLALRLASGR
jgi:diadenosine tetraphosphatase ApaH/serine/threonine PP2A family protein phosphatase